jgi:glycerol-3-phosphate acyltransferase PlsX
MNLEDSEDEALPVIAVDVMGADRGPGEVLKGVGLALKTYGFRIAKIVVFGKMDAIDSDVRRLGLLTHPKVEWCHASECIEMHEKAVQSLRQKKDASMFRAIESIKEGRADAAVSCGNTGSLMAAGTLKLRTINGLDRPALATIIPSIDHRFILVDAGANPETSVKSLVNNAILGHHYARAALQKDRPRVGLLTIGTEEGKGSDLINQTHTYLKSLDGKILNYVGLIEGFHVFEDCVDVVVCDGFVGNVLLKTCQSLFKVLKDCLKSELTRNAWRKIGVFFAQGAFRTLGKKLNPDRYGGAPLLGLKGLVIKAHGSSNSTAIMHAITIAARCAKNRDDAKLQCDLSFANTIVSSHI